MPSVTLCLHHHPLDPFSRRIRLALGEKNLAFETVLEKPWEPGPGLLSLNPSGEVPAMVVTDGAERHVLCEADAIAEFLDETQPGASLLGTDPYMRAEVRRLIRWFEKKTYTESTQLLLDEKAWKRLQGRGEPDSNRIRAGCYNIHGHLNYISWLIERRNWLAGDAITLADLAAAAQLSVIDYLGDVPWAKHPEARDWYSRIKSRPAFRPLLADHIPGLLPPRHYADLDF